MIPSFSIIIISYNGKDFLRKCLEVLKQSSVQPEKIIVVDDHSSDGTGEMVRKEFSQVEYIFNEKNLGPVAARNRGAKLATGEYIVFIDNDILVRRDSIERLLSFLSKTKDAGLVAGKLIIEEGKTMWWNMGHRPNILRQALGKIIGFFIINFFPDSKRLKKFSMLFSLNYWDYDKTMPVDWVIEGFNAVRRDIFEKTNGFDEDYFMFFEGPDLSARLRKAGYETYFVHDSVADNLGGHTHTPKKRQKWFYKSMARYYKKHYFR